MHELTHLDLFSGIGGFALAAQWAGFRTVGFCEIDPYCQRVLAKNFLADASLMQRNGSGEHPEQGSRSIPESGIGSCPIFNDIRTLDGKQFAGVSLITGGFPCQPFSCAGKRRGTADDRHLWPEMLRVIDQARPAWVLGENVAGIINMELDSCLSDLEAIGYSTRTFVIPACGVDARHRRNRVWIVALCASDRLEGTAGASLQGRSGGFANGGEAMADSNEPGSQGHRGLRECGGQLPAGPCCWPDESEWLAEPNMGRVAHGIPKRVDRLKGLGNSIVPQVAFQILQAIATLVAATPTLGTPLP